ncbi:MAG: response regulator [Longimicrobiales bacterium]
MKTILVVDDSPLIRKAIRRIIEPLGFVVREAEDGHEALTYMESGAPADGILLDVEMPVMDGISFLRTLRGRSDLAQPPVVMCTTRNSIDIITASLQAGANEFVMKPFDRSILGHKLEGIGLVA